MKEVNKGKLAFYIIASTLLITFVFYAYQICYTANVLVDSEDRMFIIKSDATFERVRDDLYNNHFINDAVSFSFLARLSSYDDEIIPGRYLLRRNMTNLQALKILKSGKQELVKITFSVVRLRKDLAEKITKNIGVSPAEFNEALDAFIANNNEGFNKENILCMFLPNTYEVYFNISPEDLVQRMNTEYKKFWSEERIAKAKEIGLTPIEVSILASIVQAESIKQDEAPVIAGLYMNRLKRNIALQADPTLVYAVGDFTLKRVLNGHKEIDSPYNTYKYPALRQAR